MKQYINRVQVTLFSTSLQETRKIFGSRNVRDMKPNYGISGNTFRAYSNWKMKPSSIYQQWARLNTTMIIKSPPKNSVSDSKKYQTWHSNLYNTLNEYWLKNQGEYLSLAHCYKLIDLYIKWISQFNFGDTEFINGITKYASCALDSQTIQRINRCYDYCLPINAPKMGDIINKNTYDFCQKIICDFCGEASATNLEFDFWAWENGG